MHDRSECHIIRVVADGPIGSATFVCYVRACRINSSIRVYGKDGCLIEVKVAQPPLDKQASSREPSWFSPDVKVTHEGLIVGTKQQLEFLLNIFVVINARHSLERCVRWQRRDRLCVA